ncbi:hypothetical protein D3C78_1537190 [compost metagenome]
MLTTCAIQMRLSVCVPDGASTSKDRLRAVFCFRKEERSGSLRAAERPAVTGIPSSGEQFFDLLQQISVNHFSLLLGGFLGLWRVRYCA